MEYLESFCEQAAILTEVAGVIVLLAGILYAFIRFVFKKTERSYRQLRQEIGRAILLGLEILVAADIIATIVTDLNMEKVLLLGLVVLIRTFLSFSLEIELEGFVPWKRKMYEEGISQRNLEK